MTTSKRPGGPLAIRDEVAPGVYWRHNETSVLIYFSAFRNQLRCFDNVPDAGAYARGAAEYHGLSIFNQSAIGA